MPAGNDPMLQQIAQALRSGALGGGGAALESQGSGYREYAMQAAMNGETPMPPEQWAAMQAGQGQPQQGMPQPMPGM